MPGIMAATRAKIIRLATYKTMNSIKNFFIFVVLIIRYNLIITAGVSGRYADG